MLVKNIISIGVIFFGMFLATLFPVIGTPLKGSETPLLMIILFVSLLGINVTDTLKFVKSSFGHILILSVCKLLILPVVMYFLFRLIWPQFAVAALLVGGVSTGVSAPFVALLAGGRRGFVVVLVVITSLAGVFTLPFLVKVLLGGHVEMSVLGMLLTLAIIVFIPIICAETVRKICPWLVRFLLGRSFFINTFLFFILGISVFSQNAHFLHANPSVVIEALVVDLVIAAVAFALALILFRRYTLDTQIAAVVVLVSINNFLVVVLANRFFGFREIIVSALFSVPFFLVVIPCQLYRAYYRKHHPDS